MKYRADSGSFNTACTAATTPDSASLDWQDGYRAGLWGCMRGPSEIGPSNDVHSVCNKRARGRGERMRWDWMAKVWG